MALRDYLNVSTRSELYNFVMQSDQCLLVLGISVAGDIPAEVWYFAAGSTAVDDGVTVIRPTSIPVGNPGRYLRAIQESSWSTTTGKPSFSTVASSGDYNDLNNKPTIPAAQVNSDWNSVSGVSQVLNKPTNVSSFSNDVGYLTSITSLQITAALGFTPYSAANPAGYITGINSALIAAALGYTPYNGTANPNGYINTVTSSNVTTALGFTPVNPNGTTSQYIRGDGSKVTFPTIPAAQINCDWNATSGLAQLLNKPSLATVATSGSYNDLSNKPTIPTVKRTETYLGTTNASGDYTVTYSTAFSVTPDIQPQLQSGTPAQVVRITSSTTTGFTVNVTNRASVVILGIEVLLAATTPVSGASVGVLVTAR